MTFDYRHLSGSAITWINDLRTHAADTNFPDIDPSAMSESERDILVAWLRDDDGSLNEADLELSCEVADGLEKLKGRK